MTSITDDNDNNRHQCVGSGEIISNKKECTSCEQNINVENITEGIGSVALLDDTSKCANCGKEGNSDDMNNCNKCKMVKYCNAACKKKHRTKHKKACERRVAELFDEQLFKEVEPEECPICFLPHPLENRQSAFHSCCGKLICYGCIYAMVMSEGGLNICPFCRTPTASPEDIIQRLKKLIDKGNDEAFNSLGLAYGRGDYGLAQNHRKANELYLKAGELGSATGYFNLACSYGNGEGVEVDGKKTKHYLELAAMNGHIKSRYNLGILEAQAGNVDRGMRHFIIAARGGYKISLEIVQKGFLNDAVTKDEYESTLRSYHERQKEMKSEMRDKAAAIPDRR